MAYHKIQKPKCHYANIALQLLLSCGLANFVQEDVKNVEEENVIYYTAVNDVQFFEHLLDLYDWVSVCGDRWVVFGLITWQVDDKKEKELWLPGCVG